MPPNATSGALKVAATVAPITADWKSQGKLPFSTKNALAALTNAFGRLTIAHIGRTVHYLYIL